MWEEGRRRFFSRVRRFCALGAPYYLDGLNLLLFFAWRFRCHSQCRQQNIVLEQEKERPASELAAGSPGWRTIGAFASGNNRPTTLNNIVGGNPWLYRNRRRRARVKSGGPASHQSSPEIRRAGERCTRNSSIRFSCLVDACARGGGQAHLHQGHWSAGNEIVYWLQSLPSHVGITVSETSEMTVVSAEKPAQLQAGSS